ncbi:hypothetical protein Pmar_PMAR001480, partial [Perkinsus marinus ATCC 50983]
MLSLCQYSFSIQYRPGKDNVVADALSRPPSARCEQVQEGEASPHPAAMLSPLCLGCGLVDDLSLDILRSEQMADCDLGPLRRRLLGQSYEHDQRLSRYISRLRRFSMVQGVLMYRLDVGPSMQPNLVPVLPSSLKDRVLHEVHQNQGHQMYRSCLLRLRSSYYWLDMEDDVRLHIYCCPVCSPEDDPHVFRPAMMATPAVFALDESPSRVAEQMSVSEPQLLVDQTLLVTGVRPVIPSTLVTACEEWSTDDINQQQDEDAVVCLVKQRLRDQQSFGRTAMKDPAFRPYRKLWSVLFLDESGLLVRMVKYLPEDEKHFVPVIPDSMRRPLLYKFHDMGGHFGKQHMWDRMRR